MKKNKLKGNKSFLALVLSDKRPDFRDILVNLGPHLKGMDNSKNPEKWNHLEFDFEHIHKVDIYISVMQLSGIAVPFKYNKVLQEALEQKVIEKVEHDNRSFYRPAPF